jgi:tripartite-type tricarboxylate transporter receptor subunit TctC
MMIKCLIFAGMFATSLSIPIATQAQPATQAGKPVRIVIPFAPGGAQDGIGRYFASQLGELLNAPVVIENKTGAGGGIAADAVAKAMPDGTTLLLATGGAISIAPHLNSKLPYDPARDLTSVALLADTPMVLAVSEVSPYKTLADVLRDAKARPGTISFASTGNGTVSHLSGELFAQSSHIKLLHVPYRGAAPGITDLLGGQVNLMVTSAASIDPFVESNKARVLATFTSKPLQAMRGAPTAEQAAGLKGLEIPVWVGLMAPSKTPPATIERIANAVLAICQKPETRDKFAGLGAERLCGGPKELARVVSEDSERWGKVIRQAGIKAE